MFFFAMEKMLVPCRPFDQICWLHGTVGTCSGSARSVGLEVGCVCACSTLTATVANVLPSYCCI